MQRPKKNSYKEFDNEKKFLWPENSPPPRHSFSNALSLNNVYIMSSRKIFRMEKGTL